MTIAIVCQRCGAPLPTPSGLTPFVACSYCGATNVVSAPRPELPPQPMGPDEVMLRRQALDRVWDEAVAHGKTPVVALRAVVAVQGSALADEIEAERAARLAEALLRRFDAENGTATLPARGLGDKVVSSRVAESSVRAVVELRSMQETEINLPFLHATPEGPRHLARRVSRADLEHLDRAGSFDVHGVTGPSGQASSAPAQGEPTAPKRWWWPFG